MSYNMTGADTIKCQWVRDIASEFNVKYCALQEHFKTVKTTEKWFSQQFRDFYTYVIPAYRLPGVDSGRGRGGLAQLAMKDVMVKRVRAMSRHPRLQAQVLTFPTCNVLWINGYMPCDPQLQMFDDTELLATLSEVESIMTANSNCEVVWAADMNWDTSRDNHFTRTVAAALTRLGLTSVWEGRDIDYTHTHTDGVSTSTIDHFLVSRRLLELVEECGPVHRGDNLSRHSAIFLSLRLGDLQKQQMTTQPPPRRMPPWDRATTTELEAYKSALQTRLQAVQCPHSMLHCRDTLCKEAAHSKERDEVVLDVLLAMVECSYTSLPLTGKARGKQGDKQVIPGWSSEVEPYRLRSNAAYRTWLAAGKPRQGEVHEAKLQSHTQFRYAVRRVKRARKLHQARGLYGAAMAGDIELMKELRRIKSGKGQMDELAETVDGATGEDNVVSKFKHVFETLYNSAGTQEEMEVLQGRIRGLLGEDSKAEVMKVTSEVVKRAAVMMKPHKMDVSQGFSSDAMLHAPDLLFGILALVFQDWLIHGTVTKSVLACAFIPLLKGSKDPGNTDSYRAIAGSSLILKLFERCILLIWGDQLHSDSLQFGFKQRCSTGTATWLVQEVMQHYLRQGSKPVAVVLDCSKAFNLAKFDLLFSRLLERGLPAVVVRVLAFSYQEQKAWIRWGRACTSDMFDISNGTRQGSVASPAFWSVYLDPLFTELREAGVGCHVAGVFVGVVGYADDLLLLAPSRDAAQRMLRTCEVFTKKSNIMFSTNENPKKSKSKALYVVGPRGAALTRPVPLQLCGRPLPWVERAEHLGHTLHQDGTMVHDCREKRAQFIDTSIKIRESFGFAHPAEQITAVEKYCTAAYGSNLWDLASHETRMLVSAWKTGHKLAWDVPRNCHTYLVEEVLAPHVTSLHASLLSRSIGFFRGLLATPSSEVVVVALLAARDLRSNLGSNLALVKDMTGLDPWVAGRGQLRTSIESAVRSEVPEMDRWRVAYLQKLLAARLEAHYTADEEEVARLQSLIKSLVTN
jgi:hypothetical protein